MAGLTSGATYVVDDACTACGACLLTCPAHAFDVGVPLRVTTVRCTDCGECIEVCPADAITRKVAGHAAPDRWRSPAAGQLLHDQRGRA